MDPNMFHSQWNGPARNNSKGSWENTGRNYKGKMAKKSIQVHNVLLLGTHSNGLKAKKASLENAVKFFNSPSAITIQKTKLRQNGIVKLNEYQIFEV